MRKYKVIIPFSLSEKILVLPDDVIYAEPRLLMMHIYHPKTRRYIGKVAIDKFNPLVLVSQE